MKKSLGFLGAVVLVFCAGTAFAQGSGNGTNECTNTSQTYSNHYNYATQDGHWYTNMARWTGTSVPRMWTNTYRVVGPEQRMGAGGPPTPADVQALVRQFQADREAFMTRQRDLQRQMDSATEQQRQQLRDQLKEQMRDWQRQQARLREQLSEQATRLRDQLRDHERLIDRASNPGTAPVPGGASGSAPRGR